MRKLVAAAVIMLVSGCSSTTNVTNVYRGEDAGADGDANDAVADSRTDAATDAHETWSAMYQCAKGADCASGLCCAVVGHDDGGMYVSGTTCAYDATTGCVLANGSTAPHACTLKNDCATSETCCVDPYGYGYCATSC